MTMEKTYSPIPRLKHLEEGYPPIIACISDAHDLTKETLARIDTTKKEGIYIDYYVRNSKEYKKGTGYTMSHCDEKMKYSEFYLFCSGITVVGTDKITGKNISFLTHQDPYTVKSLTFKNELDKAMQEMIDRCVSGSIDAVIFSSRARSIKDTRSYEESMKHLSELCENKLHFKPTILTGPNIVSKQSSDKFTDAYFDTENRRFDLVRSDQISDRLNEPFTVDEYEKQAELWKEDSKVD